MSKVFEISYALAITTLVVVFSYFTAGLYNDITRADNNLPKAEVFLPRLLNYQLDPSCCEDPYNLHAFILGITGMVTEYKSFYQVNIGFGGVFAYENATVELDENGLGNSSFVLKNIFPQEFPFPYQQYLASPFVLSKVLRPDIDATTFVQYNIQPNGVDIHVKIFITQDAPPQDGNALWLMAPVSYDYLISK